MATRREREENAKRLREEAKKFLEVHNCGPRDPNTKVTAFGRDNTFEQLRIARNAEPAPKAVQAQLAAAKAILVDEPELPKGWRVDGVYFVHETTGCAVRSEAPRPVRGGMAAFKPLPAGWKLIKNPTVNGDDAPYFYFHPSTQQTSWGFPAVEETHEFHPSTQSALNVVEDSVSSSSMHIGTIGSPEEDDAAATELTEGATPSVMAPAAIQLQLRNPATKHAKPSAIFMS